VHVRRQVKRLGNGLVFAPPKGGRERDVPLAASVGLRLSTHVAEFPPATVALPWRAPDAEPFTAGLLFTSTRGMAIIRVFDSAQWHPALRKAGIAESRENGFHALRHHFASVLQIGGVASDASFPARRDRGLARA
jgi:integrase